MSSLKGAEAPPDEVLRGALKMAAERGTMLHIVLDRDGASEDVYFLNDEASRQAVAKIESGELKLSGLKIKEPAYVEAEAPPDIFTLYEQNIGILTPMIADELRRQADHFVDLASLQAKVGRDPAERAQRQTERAPPSTFDEEFEEDDAF